MLVAVVVVVSVPVVVVVALIVATKWQGLSSRQRRPIQAKSSMPQNHKHSIPRLVPKQHHILLLTLN